ncbi:RCC1 domain-containing protein [Bacillus atrophaeus]|uniref:RCC1 domain-containing protein n=1 Tax=Bacillus atrophaeus TaxID=1452 RepID=UPI002282DD33|nr:hypothetical protein [Bacillus atrophaeus]MCY8466570.1 hypothetical protein [Bacillus atrophaeus]MCY8479030.1 hypothetical protein [Bacillus atrophaeus]
MDNNHMMVIKPDNSLWGWGYNYNGQLGISQSSQELKPVKVMENVKQVATGTSHTMAIKDDDSLWGWGLNNNGQLGTGTTNSSIGSPVKIMNEVKQVSCGHNFSLIVDKNNVLYACGVNNFGQFGNGTFSNSPEVFPIKIKEDVKQVFCGAYYTMILKTDNSLYACGNGDNGVLGTGSTSNSFFPRKIMENVKQVSCGYYHTMIITTDNSLYGCGSNNYGQLGDGTNTNRSTPIKIMEDVKSVSVGSYHSVILKSDNSLWSVGANTNGQLGLNDIINKSNFARVEIETIRSIATCSSSTIVLSESLQVYSFGQNNYGQLGIGTTARTIKPININFESIILSNEIQIKSYPLNPVTVVATCDAIEKLEKFAIRSDIPPNTYITFEFSTDQQSWKVFDFTKNKWVESQQTNDKAMTKIQVESLEKDFIQWLENKPFYIRIFMWTEDKHATPKLFGIDAFVNIYNDTPQVQSLGVSYEMLKPDYPEVFVSKDDGQTWTKALPEELTQLESQEESSRIRIKVVLTNGQELHGISYSWV